MNNNYKRLPFYIWIRRCFWILMLLFIPSYFITRYQNEEANYGNDLRLLYTFWFLPTSQVTWESYLMTQEQLHVFITKGISPKKIQKDASLASKDQNGDYYILFRFKCDRFYTRTYAAKIKCYIEGLEFPLDLEVYPEMLGGNQNFKDHIIPVHVDPTKTTLAPHLSIQWVHMSRI